MRPNEKKQHQAKTKTIPFPSHPSSQRKRKATLGGLNRKTELPRKPSQIAFRFPPTGENENAVLVGNPWLAMIKATRG